MDIHYRINDGGILSDVVATTALRDMYIKYGSIDKGRDLFDRLTPRIIYRMRPKIITE